MVIVRSPYETGLKWGIRFRSQGSGCGSWTFGLQAVSRLWKAGLPFAMTRVLIGLWSSLKCGDLRTNCGKSMESKWMKVFKIRRMSVINSI